MWRCSPELRWEGLRDKALRSAVVAPARGRVRPCVALGVARPGLDPGSLVGIEAPAQGRGGGEGVGLKPDLRGGGWCA